MSKLTIPIHLEPLSALDRQWLSMLLIDVRFYSPQTPVYWTNNLDLNKVVSNVGKTCTAVYTIGGPYGRFP